VSGCFHQGKALLSFTVGGVGGVVRIDGWVQRLGKPPLL